MTIILYWHQYVNEMLIVYGTNNVSNIRDIVIFSRLREIDLFLFP